MRQDNTMSLRERMERAVDRLLAALDGDSEDREEAE
jgi:hypothetical protein